MGLPPNFTLQRARPQVVLWTGGKRLDIGGLCRSFSFSKSLQSPAGQWSIDLLPKERDAGPLSGMAGTDLARTVRANDLVSLGFDRPGGIVLGLTDGSNHALGLTGARTTRKHDLSGSDMAKMLTVDTIVHAAVTDNRMGAYAQALEVVLGNDSAMLSPFHGVWGPPHGAGDDLTHTFTGSQLADVADWLLRSTTAMRIPALAQAGGVGRIGEFTRTDVTPWHQGQYIYTDGPKNYHGSMWGFLKSVIDEDFYELILDSLWAAPGARDPAIPEVRLTIRPKPFDEPSLGFLPTWTNPPLQWSTARTRINGADYHTIQPHEVLSMQLGASDADVFSYFEVSSNTDLFGNDQQRADGLLYPLVDLSALARAGLRCYQGRIELVNPDLGTQDRLPSGVLPSDLREFRSRLFNWYRLAEWFEAGSITVVGRDEFRIGDRVYLPWRALPRAGGIRGAVYYVVGTAHRWSLGGPYTCTLRLTRGHSTALVQAAQREFAADAARWGIPDALVEG